MFLASLAPVGPPLSRCPTSNLWLRANGVNIDGVAAKVINLDRLGKKVRPGTSGNIQVG